MSRMATKPSPLRTCSPSRTRWQKRQSDDTDDSLLGDGGRAGTHELPYRAVNEPRRVVVAVAAPRTVEEDDVLRPQLGPPPLGARHAGEGAQARAALPLGRRGHR